MCKHGSSLKRKLFWMVLVALIVRFTVIAFLYPRVIDPGHDHWYFGFEEGRVARAIATGQGFSNPLWGQSGPTAWYAPIYPYILAADFKVFGVFTTASCIAILGFQSLLSAFTCLPLFFFARRGFGEGAALAAGWAWVVYPYSVYWPIIRIWETWFAMFLLAVLFLMILKLERSPRMKHWIGFGALAGFAALLDPVLLSVFPLLALWALWRLYKQRKTVRSLLPSATACILAVIVTVSPWVIRNAMVFHKFIPVRDNIALEFRVGNSGKTIETMDLFAGPWLPWVNDMEWNEYKKMGEIAYFHLKGEQAKAYIEAHPLWYAGMCARRIVYVWTGFWSANKRYLDEQTYDPAAISLLTLLSALTFMGLYRAYRKRGAEVAAPYAIVLIVFPLIYYLTHVERWYRCPMEPIVIALAAYEVHARAVEFLRRRRQIKFAEAPAIVAENGNEIPAEPVS